RDLASEVDVQGVAVGVVQVDLRDVGAGELGQVDRHAGGTQAGQERLHPFAGKGEVRQAQVLGGVRGGRSRAGVHQVHHRLVAAVKPGAGKGERGARAAAQAQHVAVERGELLDARGADVHVVESDQHRLVSKNDGGRGPAYHR